MEDCNSKFVTFLIFFSFLLNEVCSECDNWLTVSIDRAVHKQGFHREIVSNVSWSIENYDTEVKCSLVLVCNIPRGFFIDLDEIRSQNASKIVPIGDASDFDVEKPAHLSTDQNILIYLNTQKQDAQKTLQLTTSVVLPVHLRYEQPTDDQYYVPVSLPAYTVLGRCKDIFTPKDIFRQCLNKLDYVKYPCNYETTEICDWFVMKHNLINKDSKTLVHVPVGVKKHTYFVVCGTILVTLAASYFLIELPGFGVDKAKVT